MRVRLALLALLLVADLRLLPALARLPPYLPVPGRRPARIADWRDGWLRHPLRAAASLLAPRTDADRSARTGWLILQGFVGVGALWLLLPDPFGRRSVRGPAGVAPPPDPSGAHGTARWRRPEEIRRTLARVPVRPLLEGTASRPPPAGVVLGAAGRGRRMAAWVSVPSPTVNPHVLVIGSPGSGKTRRLVLPTLWLLGQAGVSIVVTDPKGELYAATADHFRRQGYQVRTLNLIDPARSDPYNPLAAVAAAAAAGDLDYASQLAWDLAHTLVTGDASGADPYGKDPFWAQSAEALIAALALYVATQASAEARHMASVCHLLSTSGADTGAELDFLMDALPEDHPARQAYGTVRLSQDKTRAGVLTTAASKLRLFADPAVARMTARQGGDLADPGRRPTVVYLLIPDDRSTRNPIAALYIAPMYSALVRLAHATGGSLPVPLYWVLDEFANLGKIRDWDKMVAVMRGRRMAAVMILQALPQLAARYGKETAAVIAANCDTWIFLRTADRETAKEIAEKLGQYTIRTRTGSTTARRNDLSTGSSEHLSGRSLLTPDEVLRWPAGQALVLQSGQHPVRLPLPDLAAWPFAMDFEAPGSPPPVRQDDGPPPLWSPVPFAGAASTLAQLLAGESFAPSDVAASPPDDGAASSVPADPRTGHDASAGAPGGQGSAPGSAPPPGTGGRARTPVWAAVASVADTGGTRGMDGDHSAGESPEATGPDVAETPPGPGGRVPLWARGARRGHTGERPPAEAGAHEAPTGTQPGPPDLPPCPLCGSPLELGRFAVRCTGPGCRLNVRRAVAGRALAHEELAALLRDGQTPVLDGFRSRTGNRFSAALVLRRDGSGVDFAYPPRHASQ
ncbi:VirD4-like conjugal transfer protein, CD1115 family [Caldinitratiruptor microaerophilus]|uniref:Uncharacterized protein n=1 Tax=Caldinitratiruptor microaerophilus TaxID=671077 RepID=A0AA35G7W9_9FIRM|nr:type IV secretory system conjugative DNA transfer family protein [Caldinitratiruptor microaerophilus]BDG59778.1 hypothetical protein caldi_08680 [Caldinitratiruptor microaerophilus]